MRKISPNRSFAIGAFAAGLLAAGTAAAAPPADHCKLDFSPASSHWTVQGWNPFGSTPPTDDFEVTVHNRGSDACTFRMVTRLDAEPFGLVGPGPGRVPYILLEQLTSTDGTPLGGRSDPSGPITLQPDQSQVLKYRLQVSDEDLVRDGTYRQNVLLEAETSPGDSVKKTPVQLALEVVPAAVIGLRGSFTPNQGGAVVDLGELVPGQANIPLNLYVQSTGKYRLSVRSTNHGYLKLGQGDWQVPYGMTIGGRAINLAAEDVSSSTGGQAARQEALPIGFVVGPVGQQRAGVYTDLVVISIAPI